jgi:hypothetical protein
MMLATASVFLVAGAIDAAGADNNRHQGVALYTSRDRGDHLICSAVNVSDKKLGIAFAILDDNGNPLSCASPNVCVDGSGNPTTNPTPEFVGVPPGTVPEIDITLPLGSAEDAYCEAAVSGTGNADEVRVSLATTLTRMIPGTTIPVFVFRRVDGH